MKNLFTENDTVEILDRLDRLSSSSQRLWGKMEVDQMLAHCRKTLETVTGEKNLPRALMGKLIGIFLSKDFTMKNPLERMVPPIRPSRLRIERILKWRSKNQKGTSKNFRQPGRRNALDIHTLFLEKQRQ